MKNTAFDLRFDAYRYVRGDSAKITDCESLFKDSVLMPNGAACLSLICQYYRPKSIWYPKDIYCGSVRYLRDFSDIPFVDSDPQFVLYNYPNFGGNEYPDLRKRFPNAVIVCDTSLNPFVEVDADIRFYSMSKHYTRTEEMLGMIELTGKFVEDLDKLRFLRQNSGFVVYDHQCDALLKHHGNTRTFVERVCRKAKHIEEFVNRVYPNRIFATSSVLMIPMPSGVDLRKFCFETPFELRPTFGACRTFCSWQVHLSELAYIGTPYIRVSVGTDHSDRFIADAILKLLDSINSLIVYYD